MAKQERVEGELTATGAILGSPHFMSPEQASADSSQVSPRTDVYGLGAILYYALTGVPPFRGDELVALLNQVKDDEPSSPRKLNPHVDRDLETICLKCLEKAPDKRYATALELAEELERYLSGEPIQARPSTQTERIGKWMRNELAAAYSCQVDIQVAYAHERTAASVEPFAIDFTPQMDRFVVGDRLGNVAVRSLKTGEVLYSLPRFDSHITATRFSRDGNWLGICLGTMRLFVYRLTAKPECVYEVDCNWNGFDFTPSNQHLCVAISNGKISMIDLSSFECTKSLADTLDARWLRFSDDGLHLAVSGGRFARMFDVATEKEVWREGERRGFGGMDFSDDGKRLCIAVNTGQVHLLDVDSRNVTVIRSPGGVFADVQFLPNSEYFIGQYWSGQSVIQKIYESEPAFVLDKRVGRIGSDNESIGFFSDVDIGRLKLKVSRQHRKLWAESVCFDVGFSAQLPILALATVRGLFVYECGSYRRLAKLDIQDCRSVAFDPRDGSMLVGSREQGLQRWAIHLDSGEFRIGPPKQILQPDVMQIQDVLVDQDGSRFACIGASSESSTSVKVFDANDVVTDEFSSPYGPASSSLSSCGNFIATGTVTNGEVFEWDIASGLKLRKIPVDDRSVVAFVDNNLVVSERGNKTQLFFGKDYSESMYLGNAFGFSGYSDAAGLAFIQRDDGFDFRSPDLSKMHLRLNPQNAISNFQRIKWSPNGRYLAVANGSLFARIWDVGELRKVLLERSVDWNSSPKIGSAVQERPFSRATLIPE